MPKCPDCGEHKPEEQFPRNRSATSGKGAYCKPCHNARNRETVARLYGNSRHYHLKKKYGIGAKEVDALIERQGGLCAVCRKRPPTQVDHDHHTGKVRGILCLKCNAGLGALRDSVRNLYHAIEYLDPSSSTATSTGRSPDAALPGLR